MIEDLVCGYLATCQSLRLLVASETLEGLIFAACDALGIARVTLNCKEITKVVDEF